MAFKFNVGSFLGGVGSGVTAAVDREKAEAWDMKKFNLEQSAADRRIASAEARANSTYMDEARGKLAAYGVPEDMWPDLLAKGKGFLEIAFSEANNYRAKNLNPAFAFTYGSGTTTIGATLATTTTSTSATVDDLGTGTIPSATAADSESLTTTAETPPSIGTGTGGVNFMPLDTEVPDSVNSLVELRDFYYIERQKYKEGSAKYKELTATMAKVNSDIQTNAKDAYKAGEVLSTQDAIKVTQSYIVSQLEPLGLVESFKDSLKYKITGGSEPKYLANMGLVLTNLKANFTEDGVYTQPTIEKEVNRITNSLNASRADYVSSTMVKAATIGATATDKNKYRNFGTISVENLLKKVDELSKAEGDEALIAGTVIEYVPIVDGVTSDKTGTYIYFPFGGKRLIGKF